MADDAAAYLRKVGLRCRLYRVALGLSQDAFAERAAVSRMILGSIERGEHSASLLTYRALTHALGRDLGALLSEGRGVAMTGERPKLTGRAAAMSEAETAGAAWLREVGMRVRLGRVAAGLSQEELGERAGVSRVTVGSIERGYHPASVVAFRRLADALGVEIGELLRVARPRAVATSGAVSWTTGTGSAWTRRPRVVSGQWIRQMASGRS